MSRRTITSGNAVPIYAGLAIPIADNVYLVSQPKKSQKTRAILGSCFLLITAAYVLMSLGTHALLYECIAGGMAYATALMFYYSALNESVEVDRNTGTYILTRRRFSRAQARKGNIQDLDILLMKSYNPERGDSLWIRNSNANWKVMLQSQVPVKVSRQIASDLADTLGIPVSDLW